MHENSPTGGDEEDEYQDIGKEGEGPGGRAMSYLKASEHHAK